VPELKKNIMAWMRETDHNNAINPGRKHIPGSLTPADRHGSVQVVSSTNGELTTDDLTTGHFKSRGQDANEVEVVSETK